MRTVGVLKRLATLRTGIGKTNTRRLSGQSEAIFNNMNKLLFINANFSADVSDETQSIEIAIHKIETVQWIDYNEHKQSSRYEIYLTSGRSLKVWHKDPYNDLTFYIEGRDART